MENFDFTLIRHTAPILRFRLKVPEDVTSWTVLYEVRADSNDDSNTVFTKPGAISTDPTVQAANSGVFDVPLTANDTANNFVQGRTYFFRFKRTDTGFEDLLTRGKMLIL